MNNNTLTLDKKQVSVDVENVPNALLKRLIKEVENDQKNNITAYDRVHNRHNRGK